MARWDVVVAPRAAVRLDVRLGGALSAFAAALVEAPLRQARYVVTRADGRDVVFEPPPVIPAALVGLVYGVCAGGC